MAKGNSINTENHPRYPRVKVQLIGRTRDFYPTVSAVQTAMRRAGVPLQELSNFYQDATTGDEDNLLRTCLAWVDVQVR
jgi:precorrin-6B methylase 1